MSKGGARQNAGRPRVDSVRVECFIPRAAYQRLQELETQTSVYRTRVAAQILTASLLGGTLVPRSKEGPEISIGVTLGDSRAIKSPAGERGKAACRDKV